MRTLIAIALVAGFMPATARAQSLEEVNRNLEIIQEQLDEANSQRMIDMQYRLMGAYPHQQVSPPIVSAVPPPPMKTPPDMKFFGPAYSPAAPK